MVVETPEVGDFVRVQNSDLIKVILVMPESKVVVTERYLRFNNGYQTNKFNFNQITYLVRDITYTEVDE